MEIFPACLQSKFYYIYYQITHLEPKNLEKMLLSQLPSKAFLNLIIVLSVSDPSGTLSLKLSESVSPEYKDILLFSYNNRNSKIVQNPKQTEYFKENWSNKKDFLNNFLIDFLEPNSYENLVEELKYEGYDLYNLLYLPYDYIYVINGFLSLKKHCICLEDKIPTEMVASLKEVVYKGKKKRVYSFKENPEEEDHWTEVLVNEIVKLFDMDNEDSNNTMFIVMYSFLKLIFKEPQLLIEDKEIIERAEHLIYN